MKKLALFMTIFVGLVFYHGQQNDVSLVTYELLEEKIANNSSKVLVVNFWATTCAPCVRELPHFMEVHEQYKNNPEYDMLLVSLDRAKDIEKVNRFIENKSLTADVVILNDIKRMNTWIPKFDAEWQGEIPVTIFYAKGKKVKFHNGELSKEDLEKIIKELL